MGETDLISRQAAIDAICKACSMEEDYHKCDGYPETSTWCDYLVALRALPSAQPKWIPVSERLPEKPNMYTVTDSKGDVVRFIFYDNESSREYWRRCAKAWMPLPEPYKEEQE